MVRDRDSDRALPETHAPIKWQRVGFTMRACRLGVDRDDMAETSRGNTLHNLRGVILFTLDLDIQPSKPFHPSPMMGSFFWEPAISKRPTRIAGPLFGTLSFSTLFTLCDAQVWRSQSRTVRIETSLCFRNAGLAGSASNRRDRGISYTLVLSSASRSSVCWPFRDRLELRESISQHCVEAAVSLAAFRSDGKRLLCLLPRASEMLFSCFHCRALGQRGPPRCLLCSVGFPTKRYRSRCRATHTRAGNAAQLADCLSEHDQNPSITS